MKLRDYIRSLSADGKEAYAERCGTTANYLINHLLPARKEPRKDLRVALASQSEGKVDISEVIEHFSIDGGSSAA